LKNGDPLIFARGGQEAEHLAREKIPFKIVPGVTAATAAAAQAGIPLTDRRYASVLSFITGHEDPSKGTTAIDWKNISRKGTLVFYMGVENLTFIVKQLIRYGRKSSTPVAIVEKTTLPGEKIVFGNLENIIRKAKLKKVKPPAIIIVGEVVKLRKQPNPKEKENGK
ncbi:MAG TPA: HemD protein, partial [Elusimicrobia bacterium]|nr:HemD protein [Elusimicrobiota bacterium]